MLITHIAAVRRTPRSNSPSRAITPHPHRPSPTSPSKTSATSSPLARPPNATPNAHHAPIPRYLRTITLHRGTRSRGKTRKRRGICDNFKLPSTQPTRPLLSDPTVLNITVCPLRKPRTAPHPPFRIPLRPLPQRTNAYGSSHGNKSIDLVTPWAYSSTAPSTPPQYSQKGVTTSTTSTSSAQGEIMYEKAPIPSASPADGSLGRLLASPL
jgi:hypothetical protein